MVEVSCTVRGCGGRLARASVPGAGTPMLVCPRGHAFNVARGGYANLLQPQDRRSREPGDPRAVVEARRRLLGAGFGDGLLAALGETHAELGLARGARTLDAGCGEGFFLDALARRFDLDAVGIDISSAAIAAAARSHPGPSWLIANADRRLPFADGALDLVLSITARRNPPEFARVLAPGGFLVVAVPAPDDQAELREALLGAAHERERGERVAAEHAQSFELLLRREERTRRRCSADEILDLATVTYRAGRARRVERAADLGGLVVTSSHVILAFRRS